MLRTRVSPSRFTPYQAVALVVIAALSTAAETAAAPPPPKPTPPSAPPSVLPIHSALPEDLRPQSTVLTSPAPPVTNVVLPSADGSEFITVPPFGQPQTSALIWPEEPPYAPPLSLRPSYVTPGAKQGSFQNALHRATYLPRLDETDGFGMTDVTQQLTFAVPPFLYGSPILISPAVTTHFLDGPATLDLPSRVYDFELEFRYMKQVTGRWGVDLSIAPSYYGDLENDNSDAWRLTGRAISAWAWTPTVKLVGGAWFLGREDIPVSPIFGAVWKPNDCWQFDILVPRPRIYHRFEAHDDVKNWIYLGGEFGGNSWAIDRAGGVADKFTYRDLRLVVGWERTKTCGLNARVELGWVFDREIEYESGIAGFNPSDTFMLRGELNH
jgi:hypothetical protein